MRVNFAASEGHDDLLKVGIVCDITVDVSEFVINNDGLYDTWDALLCVPLVQILTIDTLSI